MSQLRLRLQTNKGVRRIELNPAGKNVGDLKNLIYQATGVLPQEQQVSLERGGPILKNNIASLSVLNFKDGAMLYVNNTITDFKTPSTVDQLALQVAGRSKNAVDGDQEPIKLTPHCQHNETGRCLHCDPARKDGRLQIVKPKCNHGPGFTCMNCSAAVQAAEQSKKDSAQSSDLNGQISPVPGSESGGLNNNEKVASWLCSHPPSSFCPKCIPSSSPADNTMSDDKILQRDTATGEMKNKVNFLPFNKYLAQQKPQCANRHPVQKSCPMCLPPPYPSYAFNPKCGQHAPYPAGQCVKCMPANILLQLQKYRHVDGISISQRATQYMFSIWNQEIKNGEIQPNQQRVWLLFGKVANESADSGEDPDARRAIVSAIYQPAQTFAADGHHVDVDLENPTTKSVIDFAQQYFNSSLVGWFVCVPPLPTDEKLYGGKAVISTPNVIRAANFQWKNSKVFKVGADKPVYDPTDKESYRLSEFVTVIAEQSDAVEPQTFMISDQGMCMARDGALVVAPNDEFLFQTPKQVKTPVPSILFHKSALEQGLNYIPDQLLVKVRTMTGTDDQYLFCNYFFESNNQSKLDIRGYLNALKYDPLHKRLSDFNLLHAISHYIHKGVFDMIALHILQKKPFSDHQAQLIQEEFKSADIWP